MVFYYFLFQTGQLCLSTNLFDLKQIIALNKIEMFTHMCHVPCFLLTALRRGPRRVFQKFVAHCDENSTTCVSKWHRFHLIHAKKCARCIGPLVGISAYLILPYVQPASYTRGTGHGYNNRQFFFLLYLFVISVSPTTILALYSVYNILNLSLSFSVLFCYVLVHVRYFIIRKGLEICGGLKDK